MAIAPAQIPTSFGHELRACLRCRLVKTYDQVYYHFNIFCCFFVLLLFVNTFCFVSQFRESGCENCQFFKMEEDHERVVECTTPNFNGLVGVNCYWLQFFSISTHFDFLLPFNYTTGSFQLWIPLAAGLPDGCALVCSFISCCDDHNFSLPLSSSFLFL